MRSILIFVLGCALLPFAAIAGDGSKAVRAERVSTAPHVDGFLNDDAWRRAQPAIAFTQRDPDEGRPASEPSEIRVLYDDSNVYFGCMFYDARPDGIVARLTRRDNEIESDFASIRIDSFHDSQNCYEFTFNPAGVKIDILQYEDANKEDASWDVVWDLETRILDNGWSAEVRIPLSVLRYRSIAGEQEWGINFIRYISRKKETSRWTFTPKSETGFVSRFGHLTGLDSLPNARRLELLPFVVTKQDWQPEQVTRRRIDAFSGDAGLDVKYSLSNNFLLDATVNPDFGQVEADPAVLNLSTFETFYPEKRPFFIEGTQIIRFTTFGDAFGPGMFYSRRIGRALHPGEAAVPARCRITAMPHAATILGAAKVSGKTDAGTSVGILQAFTKEMRATVADSAGNSSEQIIEPFAHYNVLRLRQDVLDNSVVGVIFTSTAKQHRLPGVTAGADWNLKFDNTFQLDGFLGMSHANHLLTRGERGFGSAGKVNFSRIAAEHWLWSAGVDFTSKGYNINDVGFFNRPNDYGLFASWTYKEDRPAAVVRTYSVTGILHERENFDGVNLFRELKLSTSILFQNYWTLNLNGASDFGEYDDRETRGNGLYQKSSRYEVNLGIDSDERQVVNGSLSVHTGWDSKRKFAWGPVLGIEVRPLSWMEYEFDAGYNRTQNQESWVTNVGSSSIFGDRTTEQVSFTLRGTITFTRDLTLQLYGQLFLAKGHYEQLHSLSGLEMFGVRSPDFNSQSVNTNLVLRWEYIPGSTLFLVWSHAREGGNGNFYSSLGDDIRSAFRTSPGNVLLLKASYWLNM
ncbi:MAG: carbohydrate binding family 9 domain-containing protein [Ignavibacteriae bacterium]|nr:carbohydrate binding family 9 domain-containing protein [Ignavibacteriota bacterium]